MDPSYLLNPRPLFSYLVSLILPGLASILLQQFPFFHIRKDNACLRGQIRWDLVRVLLSQKLPDLNHYLHRVSSRPWSVYAIYASVTKRYLVCFSTFDQGEPKRQVARIYFAID
jgi:hypothetical protein